MSAVAGDLTIFVISTGEETLDECEDALARQTRRARVERIVDVYPMSAAFQAMPDRCETPYFLQVDADMLLHENAVQRLHDAVRRSPPWVFQVSGQLFEEGFGVGGAVKCWKRALFRAFSFRDVRTVDRDLYRRARRFGLRPKTLQEVVGVHRPRHSEESTFLKAKGDVEKWRFLGRPVERYALPLLDELEDGSEPDRLLGALCGALTVEPRLSRSKDIRAERALRREVCARVQAPPAVDADLRSAFRDAYSAPPVAGRAERARLAELLGDAESAALVEGHA